MEFLKTGVLLLFGFAFACAQSPPRFLDDQGQIEKMKEALEHVLENTTANVRIGPPLECIDPDGDSTKIRIATGLNYVKIDRFGQVSLINALDRESEGFENRRKIKIVCEERFNPDSFTLIEATLVIIDINDNAPFFQKANNEAYFVVIPEDTPTGTFIYDQIEVVDIDGSENNIVEGICLEECDTFEVRSRLQDAGHYRLEIWTKKSVRGKLSYTMKISARDVPRGGEKSLTTGTQNVVITIKDVQDLPPDFAYKPLSFSIYEDQRQNTQVGSKYVGAYDQDSGDPNAIRLELFSHPNDPDNTFAKGLFALGPLETVEKSGNQIWQAHLTLLKPLDREDIIDAAKILRLRVRAIEYPPVGMENDTDRNPMSADETLEITVLDRNDERPLFNNVSYEVEFPERARITDSTFFRQISNKVNINVRDRDGQRYNSFEVEISDGNDDNVFKLDRTRGQGQEDFTILAQDGFLDYEITTNRLRQLTLTARDLENPLLSSEATVFIRVLDINDNAPKFVQNSYSFPLNEQLYQTSYFVGQVQAFDLDSGSFGSVVTYRFTGPTEDKFSIDDTGAIYVQGDIDYEVTPSFALTVTAYDGGEGNNQRSADVGIQIIINNVPDIGPRFLASQYETYVLERSTTLEPDVVVTAQDPEGFGEITYSVNSTEPSLPGYFIIPDPLVGRLILTQPIDYKQTIGGTQPGIINVRVQACTSEQSRKLCALTNVIVNIQDQNNFAPEFRPSNYYSVNITELALAGTVVLQVSTYDADIETDPNSENAEVTYQMGSGHRDAFKIDSQSGEIKVSGDVELDVDVYETYRMLIIARDRGNPSLSTTATVVIHVEDDNNKDPSFTETTYFRNVFDYVPIGTDIPPAVSATDPDRDHIIRYSLDFSNLIVELEGEIVTSSESMQSAMDALAIDPITGMLKTGSELDRLKYEVINFGVMAEDINIDKSKQQAQTATASVILFVLGTTDTNPYFIAPGKGKYDKVIQISRPESEQVNWPLYSLYAFDPKLLKVIERYEETEGTDEDDYFQIDGRIIRVKQKIDYEALPRPKQLSLSIQAITEDGERSAEANLIVDITDVNDNAPKFPKISYSFSISEEAVFPTEVGSVYATDADSGTYGEVQYSVEGTKSEDFMIITKEDRLATLYVSRGANLDYETFPRYTLYVTATDNPGIDRLPSEQLKTTVVVIVNILDENDNNPIFEQDEYSFSVIGTKPVNEEIAFVLAEDLDRGRNGEITYGISSLSSSNSSFYFGVSDSLTVGTGVTGRIYVRNSLQSLPDNSVFTLTLVASDKGQTVIRTGTTKVKITVSKGVRDPNPKWDPNLISIVNVTEDRKKGYSIANITAHPANKSSAVSYEFVGRGDADQDFQTFKIDKNTGHVTLDGELDYEEKTSYDLLIRASDVSNNSLTNQFLLTVLVVDVDDNIPAFNACREFEYPIPVPATVRENAPVPTYVFTARACDLDSERHNRVRYRWHYDSREMYGDKTYCRQADMELFNLDAFTGEIHTAVQLDREVKDSHLLCVTVDRLVGRRKRDMITDLRNRTNHHEILYILVTVIDTNDEGPKFFDDTDSKVILEYPPVSLTVARAYDRDLDPYNEIRYSIDQILFTKGGKSYQAPTAFNINSRDGTITIGTNDYSDYVDGFFTISVRAADARGEFTEMDTMNITVYVGRSSDQIRVVFNQPADTEVELLALQMIDELNGLKETGVYYEIESIGYHIVSNAEDPVFDKTDVCMVVVRDNRVMSSLDSVKRLSDVQAVKDILNKYGAVEPGPCEPARSVYPVGWESYWWVLVAFAIFIFVITLILIIIVVFLYRSYRHYMDSHKTYLVPGN